MGVGLGRSPMSVDPQASSTHSPIRASALSQPVPTYTVQTVRAWGRVPAVKFADETRALVVAVRGVVRNSIPNTEPGRSALHAWKQHVTKQVGERRGVRPWSANDEYAVSLGLRFHLQNHWNREVDIDNYCKPVLDAVAAGLFDPEPDRVTKWRGYPEHRFRTLLIHRLRDGAYPEQEGAVVIVSARAP